MTILQPFFDRLKEILKTENIVLQNPKSGASIITKIDDKINYIRGENEFALSLKIIIAAFEQFNGKRCSTGDLAKFDKEFTDKNGDLHCGCTFFLMLMREFFGVPILGKGVKGDPFYINLNLLYRNNPIKLFIRNLIFGTGKGYLSVIDFTSVKLAVDIAYLAMMPRTIRKKITGSSAKINETEKEKVLCWLAEEFVKFFICRPTSFDEWHKTICGKFLKEFNDVLKKSGYASVRYGKAQKIVNVTFKNLYLFDDAELYEDYFYDCHFILSSENLDWYKKYVDTKWEKIAWSNLNYDEYITIQNEIRDFLKIEPTYPSIPFIAEFYIWSSSFQNKILQLLRA